MVCGLEAGGQLRRSHKCGQESDIQEQRELSPGEGLAEETVYGFFQILKADCVHIWQREVSKNKSTVQIPWSFYIPIIFLIV